MTDDEGQTIDARSTGGLGADRLAALAHSLLDGFDAVDLADRVVRDCQRLEGVAEAAIVLDDPRGHVRVLACSTEDGQLANLLEDPRVGAQILDQCLLAWGLAASHAVPLRFRDQVLGSVNLYSRGHALTDGQLGEARMLASLTTLALLAHRAVDRQDSVVQRVEAVFNDRITIEQAKGVVAERASVSAAAALQVLRDQAHRDRRTLSATARRVVAEQDESARSGSR